MQLKNEWYRIKISNGNDCVFVEVECDVVTEVEKLKIVHIEKVSNFNVSYKTYIDNKSFNIISFPTVRESMTRIEPSYFPIFISKLANHLQVVPLSIIIEEGLYGKSIRKLESGGRSFTYILPPDDRFFELDSKLIREDKVEFENHYVIDRRKYFDKEEFEEKNNFPYFPGYYHDFFKYEIDRIQDMFKFDNDIRVVEGIIECDFMFFPPVLEAVVLGFIVNSVGSDNKIEFSKIHHVIEGWNRIFD